MSNTHHHVQYTDNTTPSHSPTSPTSSTDDILSDVIRSMENKNHPQIEPDLYNSIVNGDKTRLPDLESTKWELISTMEGSNGNNVLHIAAESRMGYQLVDLLLQRCYGLATKKNSKGNLPIHSAAKAGLLDAIKALTNWDIDASSEKIGRELLGRSNDDGDTPLHLAIENNELESAECLMGKYDEACYKLNHKKVCPLYMAIIQGDRWDLVKRMLSFTKKHNPDSGLTLLKGKSIVHAAITAGNLDILKIILENHGNLIESFGEGGRTPLSYAAFKGLFDVVNYLMENFPTYVYKCDKDGSFPIHSAASGGHTKIILKLGSTWELLNKEGQNILHVAARNGKSQVVSYLLSESRYEKLINSKDEDGNTPLHLASKQFHPRVVYMFTWDKRVNKGLKNKDGLTPLDVAEIRAMPSPPFEARLTSMALRYVDAPRSSHSTNMSYILKKKWLREKQDSTISNDGMLTLEPNGKPDLEKYKARIDTHLVVATLVATVTFAAGFTVPGGYKQSDNDPYIGMAVLAHKWAFNVFVICNTAAMYSAILSVVTLIWAQLNDLKLLNASLKVAIPLLGFSLSMMSMAFLMGMYVVLRNRLWLSYLVLSMGSAFTAVVLLFFIPLYNPSYIKKSVVRYFFSGAFLLLLLVNDKTNIQER